MDFRFGHARRVNRILLVRLRPHTSSGTSEASPTSIGHRSRGRLSRGISRSLLPVSSEWVCRKESGAFPCPSRVSQADLETAPMQRASERNLCAPCEPKMRTEFGLPRLPGSPFDRLGGTRCRPSEQRAEVPQMYLRLGRCGVYIFRNRFWPFRRHSILAPWCGQVRPQFADARIIRYFLGTMKRYLQAAADTSHVTRSLLDSTLTREPDSWRPDCARVVSP